MRFVLDLAVVIACAVAMEGVAWLTHKYVMHGFLWVLHEGHHHPKKRGLEKNDLFAVFFALISILLILFGTLESVSTLVAAGIGVALYGLGYTLFHDVMFHKRIPGIRIKPSTPYLRRIYDAHSIHHRTGDKEGSVSFGFLYARAPK